MNCLTFLRRAPKPAALIGLLLAVLTGAPDARAQSNEYRGFWADAWSTDLWTSSGISQIVNDLRAGNMNMIIPQVRRRGDALYNSNYEPKCQDINANFDPLADLITKAHDTSGGKQRIEVHAWIVTYHIWKGVTNASSPPQASHPVRLHPDWLLKDNTGETYLGGHYTFDPGHPEVQRHTYNVCMDIITNYDVDGLNFDYIRYSNTTEGYNDVTVARFNQRFGRTGQPATTDALWKQFRRDQITGLLRKVYLNAIAVKPHVKISADTITWAPGPADVNQWYSSSSAWNSVLQDWRGWMEEGILDLNIPMAYFRTWTHPADYTKWINFTKDHQYNRHAVIGPGIYLNSVDGAIAQMREAMDPSPSGNRAQGTCGYSFRVTNKDGVSRSTFLNALVNPSAYDPVTPPIFNQRVPVPAMPWKSSPANGHAKGTIYGGGAIELDGAVVTLTGPVSRVQTNDATGFYGFVDLPPGDYTVTASFAGYENGAANFTVTPGAVATRDMTLALAAGTPDITGQPQSLAVTEGSDAIFTVTATGADPLSYQWRFNGASISGATNSSYTRTNTQFSDAGNYSVVVTNAIGSVTSSNAVLTVSAAPAAPSITAHPQGQGVPVGANVTFNVTATGAQPLAYQWRFEGADIPGATDSSLQLSNVQTNDAGTYDVRVSNSAGTNFSSGALLAVFPPSPAQVRYAGRTGDGKVRLEFSGGTNSVYLIETSTNLFDWARLTTVDGGTGTVEFTDPGASAHSQRFYRARSVTSYLLTDFEALVEGVTNVFFNRPSYSGSSSSYVDATAGNPNYTMVTNTFPAGNTSGSALQVGWVFKAGATTNTWLRLTTFTTSHVPNPTIGFGQAIRFDVHCDKEIYLALGSRETGTTADIGENGGTSGPIEWIGGVTDNTTYPPKGQRIPAGEWTTVHFFIPSEPVAGFTGNGVLEPANGKGTLEHLAIIPGASGLGPYILHVDNFRAIDLP